MTDAPQARGLPGGIAAPAVCFIASMIGFMVLFTHPDLVEVGGRFSPAGMCVLGAVVTFFWLLVAIGKRPPSEIPPS